MAELRWILLILGFLFLAGLYLYSMGWLGRGAALALKFRPQRETVLSDGENHEPRSDLLEPQAQCGDLSEGEAEPAKLTLLPEAHSKIVAIRMQPKSGQSLSGAQLAKVLYSAGLRHGKFDIFHRADPLNESRVLFSVASLVEPGSLNLNENEESEHSGISLFMVLPGPEDVLAAFDEMLSVAKSLAQSFGANLLDEHGSALSVQRARYMREELVEFQHQNSRANVPCW